MKHESLPLQVMYITGSFPYVVTTIYLIRGITLPGAAEGVIYMFTPDVGTESTDNV